MYSTQLLNHHNAVSIAHNTQSITNSIILQQRIEELKKNQHLHFLQRFEQQQMYQDSEQITTHISKTKMINSSTSEKIKDSLSNLTKTILTVFNTDEKINIDTVKLKFNEIIDAVESYNNELDSWYDDKYYSDKEKLYESIEKNALCSKTFLDKDYIFIRK